MKREWGIMALTAILFIAFLVLSLAIRNSDLTKIDRQTRAELCTAANESRAGITRILVIMRARARFAGLADKSLELAYKHALAETRSLDCNVVVGK